MFRQGDPGAEMFVVHRGRVSVSARVGTASKVLATFGPGEFFGEMAILNGTPRSATATCEEDSLLVVVDARTFEAMVRANAEIAVRLIQKLARRLADANRQIENLMLRDPRARVVHHVAAEAAMRVGAPLVLDPEDLATRLHVEARQASDVIRTLERSGLLAGSEGAWTVPDPDRLAHFLDLLQLDGRTGGRT